MSSIPRRTFLSALPAALAAQSAPSRPNIIFVLFDDMGYSDLGCYGNRVIQTPNLDRIASRGVRFSDFYANGPVCSPSRAAFMTGQYQQRHNIRAADLPENQVRYFLKEDAVTIGKVMRSAGYYTAHVGKWHLGEPPQTVVPRKQGFDRFYGCFGGRPSSTWSKYARSMDPEIIVNEERPVTMKGHITEVLTNEAIEVIREQSGAKRPFFLNLWHHSPHEPLAPLPYQSKLYRYWSSEEQTYFQTVTDLDTAVGRLLDAIEKAGIANNTLLFFTSDNGPEAHSMKYARGSAWPLKGMKTQLWEGGIRVPGLMYWPGRTPEGLVCRAPATGLDLFPTFCAAAGAKPPASYQGDSSVDLRTLVRLRNAPARPLFFEYLHPQRGVESSLPMAVRRGPWKLFSDYDFERTALFNLEEDPSERTDLSAANPAVVKGLRADLRNWWAQYKDTIDMRIDRGRNPVPTPEELEQRYFRN